MFVTSYQEKTKYQEPQHTQHEDALSCFKYCVDFVPLEQRILKQ